MKRATLAIAVLVTLACLAGTASAAGGTPASLAANVASATVAHRPFVYGPVVPVYRPRAVLAPVVVPVRPIVRPPLYYRPVYRPIIGPGVYVETPYVSVGVGY